MTHRTGGRAELLDASSVISSVNSPLMRLLIGSLIRSVISALVSDLVGDLIVIVSDQFSLCEEANQLL